jgi:hypothetical protein
MSLAATGMDFPHGRFHDNAGVGGDFSCPCPMAADCILAAVVVGQYPLHVIYTMSTPWDSSNWVKRLWRQEIELSDGETASAHEGMITVNQ